VPDSVARPTALTWIFAKLTGQESRYVIVGLFNTAFGLGVFAALHAALGDAIPYWLLLVPTYAIGIVVSFLTQRYLVFQVRGQFGTDLARFTVVQLGALGLNAIALPLVRESTGLPVVVSQAVALAIVVVITYFSHLHFSFRRTQEPT
jgi:putative flippase GtrA